MFQAQYQGTGQEKHQDMMDLGKNPRNLEKLGGDGIYGTAVHLKLHPSPRRSFVGVIGGNDTYDYHEKSQIGKGFIRKDMVLTV